MDPINASSHPLLYLISQNAKWVGRDDFPVLEWRDECEKWLRFVDNAGALLRFLPRLTGENSQRDDALAEIKTAYFLETHCGLLAIDWEPPGAAQKKGDILVSAPTIGNIFVEVKSPGWESEIALIEGRESPRLLQPKYINESRATDPASSVRYAVRKAYPKLLDTMPTLLVIADDLAVPLNKWPSVAIEHPLYYRKGRVSPGDGYENGCFADNQFERLGAVGILNTVWRDFPTFTFTLFRNSNAIKSVEVPLAPFSHFRCQDAPS